MPWNEKTVMSQRYEFVQIATVSDSVSISELCRRYGVSRKTGYKWLQRFEEKGSHGLQDHSRRPKNSPNETPCFIVQAVIQLRDQHPAWGGRKIKARLETLGYKEVPSPSTLTSIFHRQGRMFRDSNRVQKRFLRFEHKAPNHLWQMDFKGRIPIHDKYSCSSLTILDDHSRFNLCLKACPSQRRYIVQETLIETFRKYGLPYRMVMDNGSPWGGHQGTHTKLTAWLIRLGVHVIHAAPYHPQTQGKVERFHRTLKRELLNHTSYLSLSDCQTQFHHWREIYNFERPHEALGMKPPASRYQPSFRTFPEILPPIEYDSEDIIRKVDAHGNISYKARLFPIGLAFEGDPVAIKNTAKDGLLNIYYCHQKIKTIDLKKISI